MILNDSEMQVFKDYITNRGKKKELNDDDEIIIGLTNIVCGQQYDIRILNKQLDKDILSNESIIESQRKRIEALECQVRTLIKMVQNLQNEWDNNRKEK